MRLWNLALIIAGAVMILVEVVLGGFAGFDLVLLGSALVIGGTLGWLTGSATTGVVLAAALCIAYVALGRRWVRRRMQTRHVPSNADAVVGREAVVLQRIAPHAPGQVKVNDEVWRAAVVPGSSQAFEPSEHVTVIGVDGVTLHVKQAAS
jgi:membrane protein implicated in regulation of membrane protease activity